MITVKDLIFEYPGKRALNGVSLTVKKGSITALVGPNGAGKTTLLRCLAALDEPLSGKASIDGMDVTADPRECHRRTGYLSDFFGLYDEMTVHGCLDYMAAAHGIRKDARLDAVLKAAGRTGITGRLNEKAGSLSRGLRQRLAIAQAIIHEPRLLLLDEPASGLDPEARSSLSGLFLNLKDQGMTLVVSSHIIAELEEYSTDMLVLRDGTVAAQRPLGARAALHPMITITLAGPSDGLAAELFSSEGVSEISIDGSRAIFRFSGGNAERHVLMKSLIDAGFLLSSFTEEKPDMREEYISAVRGGAGGEVSR